MAEHNHTGKSKALYLFANNAVLYFSPAANAKSALATPFAVRKIGSQDRKRR
jgi:hypothetical protein